jgi:hypothetical protein
VVLGPAAAVSGAFVRQKLVVVADVIMGVAGCTFGISLIRSAQPVLAFALQGA